MDRPYYPLAAIAGVLLVAEPLRWMAVAVLALNLWLIFRPHP